MVRSATRALSLDLRERIMAAVDAAELPLAGVAARFAVSHAVVKKLVGQRRRPGHVEPMGHGGGQPRRVDLEGLLEAVAADPEASLAELQARVPALDGGKVSLGAVSQWLKKLGLTRKKRPSAPPRPTRRPANASKT